MPAVIIKMLRTFKSLDKCMITSPWLQKGIGSPHMFFGFLPGRATEVLLNCCETDIRLLPGLDLITQQ